MILRREAFVSEAIKLLDESGLNDFSARKVAIRLDVQAPAVYWHFKNREALVDAMAEAILQERFSNFTPRVSDEPWQEWLAKTMRELRRAMLAHTDGARVVAGAHLYSAATLGKISDISMQSLCEAGIDLLDARQIVMTAMHYTFGQTIEEQSSPSVGKLKQTDRETMKELYPTTAAAIKAAHEANRNNDDDFDDGLRLIIAGSTTRS
jgi:TetR/AcrR family tetracycline transcriptional repressor